MNSCLFIIYSALFMMTAVIIIGNASGSFVFRPTQVLSFTHPVSFHSAETFESLLGCLKMDDEKVAEAALQIFKNTGSKMEESFPHIKSYVSLSDWCFHSLFGSQQDVCNHTLFSHTYLHCDRSYSELKHLHWLCFSLCNDDLVCSPKCFAAGTTGQSQERPPSPGQVCYPLHKRHVHQQRHTLRSNLWGQSVPSLFFFFYFDSSKRNVKWIQLEVNAVLTAASSNCRN